MPTIDNPLGVKCPLAKWKTVGKIMGHDCSSLPKGVYIKGGKNVLK